jgi:MYXO-CTERM domain-containing protein
VSAEQPFVCTQACDDSNVCPDGFSCQSGFCFAGTGDQVITTTTTSGGCSVAPAAPTENASLTPLAALAGLGLVASRRRRRAV